MGETGSRMRLGAKWQSTKLWSYLRMRLESELDVEKAGILLQGGCREVSAFVAVDVLARRGRR